jgi:hypothetical protein
MFSMAKSGVPVGVLFLEIGVKSFHIDDMSILLKSGGIKRRHPLPIVYDRAQETRCYPGPVA